MRDSRLLTRSEAELRVQFDGDGSTHEYLKALASLTFPSSESSLVVDVDGVSRDDLELQEIVDRIKAGRLRSLRFELQSDAGRSVRIDVASRSEVVTLAMPVTMEQPATQTIWLQADARFPTALPVIAFPLVADAASAEALHALVALAVKAGAFSSAVLQIGSEPDPRMRWSGAPFPGGVPVVGRVDDALWAVAEATDEESGPGVAWCRTLDGGQRGHRISTEWWARFDALVNTATSSRSEIEQHLRDVVPGMTPWRLGELAEARHAEFMSPVEDALVCALIPTAKDIVVAIDFAMPAETLRSALLHAAGHLALQHVRPGDVHGHWDNAGTVTTREPHRLWDRQVREFVAANFERSGGRRIESVADCTPHEKAKLGLWRMVHEMLGESRRLHPAAERYQNAAYQRQAAERIVGMLQDFDGAMLCDGVGLGKTYVATTLMVHYANLWRQQWASTPDRLIEDPFRITVLAPNSVVSTWRREALPPLAAFGVPLSMVRVISHTKLSRMTPTSELLEPVRGGLSDLEHLLMSDLVIVDEAHNFRSLGARRTKVLRDLLRLQPRRDLRRRVVLLTATPINNSLDDLRQELSLLFSRPLWVSEAKTVDGYRRQAGKDFRERCVAARRRKRNGDVSGLVIHGDIDARFSDAIEFRDDLDFGVAVQRIGDYVREQDRKLRELQQNIRADADSGSSGSAQSHSVRIAEELLDRIVVQRSRALCKQIEHQTGSEVRLLFRPDAVAPERLYYADEYDGIEDVLRRFLPLFDRRNGSRRRTRGLAQPEGLHVVRRP